MYITIEREASIPKRNESNVLWEFQEAGSISTGSDTTGLIQEAVFNPHPREKPDWILWNRELPLDEHYCSKDQLDQNHESKEKYI